MNKTKWITQTALMLALLLVLQAVTKGMGQLVTGSCVNFILVMTSLLCGISSGAVVAIVSPFLAFLLSIGPAFLPIVPCIAVGNLVLVLVVGALKKKILAGKAAGLSNLICVWIGAVIKFAVLFILIVKLVLPMLGLPDQKVAILSASFSWPQLITALIGGSIAALVAPLVGKAKSNS